MRLVLASRSPQRVKLLGDAGYTFDCDPADIDEEAYPRDLTPPLIARWLARAKATHVANRNPDACVLAADTVVALGDQLLGKPEDPAHAARMLAQLSGSTHAVTTGVALIDPSRKVDLATHVTSMVQMRRLSEDEIARYIASDQWRGKAGGYGIQDNDPFVTCMQGSVTNVIGLPMEKVQELLQQAEVANR